jgi:hypothetical protein
VLVKGKTEMPGCNNYCSENKGGGDRYYWLCCRPVLRSWGNMAVQEKKKIFLTGGDPDFMYI